MSNLAKVSVNAHHILTQLPDIVGTKELPDLPKLQQAHKAHNNDTAEKTRKKFATYQATKFMVMPQWMLKFEHVQQSQCSIIIVMQ